MDWLTKNELIHPYLPRVSPTAAGKPAAIRNWTRRAGPEHHSILFSATADAPAANQDWTHLRRVPLTRRISLHLSSILIQIQYTRMFLVTDPPRRIKP